MYIPGYRFHSGNAVWLYYTPVGAKGQPGDSDFIIPSAAADSILPPVCIPIEPPETPKHLCTIYQMCAGDFYFNSASAGEA